MNSQLKRWRRDVARRHAPRDWMSVTGVRPLLRILPVVEGTVPPANVIAVAIAMEFASDAAAHAGSPVGGPAHVHVRGSRQSGRRLNNDPGLEGTL
jgi:hypothetical protein